MQFLAVERDDFGRVVGEAEGLEVRVVDGLGQLHRIGLALSQLPDLGG